MSKENFADNTGFAECLLELIDIFADQLGKNNVKRTAQSLDQFKKCFLLINKFLDGGMHFRRESKPFGCFNFRLLALGLLILNLGSSHLG
ncbi:MAG: hypothetical protein BWY75_00258 [bacterium ADurb.Bin425]|nr:MAG: hypothetical protein BWY75_00258 [bacterium ADurb.Bin425]